MVIWNTFSQKWLPCKRRLTPKTEVVEVDELKSS